VTPRPHRVLIPAVACASALVPALAPAQPVSTLPTAPEPRVSALAPGVTYERAVVRGGQVIHIVRARANARTGLRAVQAGGSPAARGSLTGAVASMRDTHGAVAGVNGDFFNFSTSNPSGVVMIDGRLVKEPEPSRSALLIRSDGLLDAAMLSLAGRWQAIDVSGAQRFRTRTFQGLNRSAQRPVETILYTTDYGSIGTPAGPSRFEARIRLDLEAPVLPGAEMTGVVVDARAGGGMTIGRRHVVMAGIGSSGATVAAELQPGRRVTITPGLGVLPAMAPLDPAVTDAIGGGPLLVRDGRPIANAGEGLTSAQTGSRTARTAVGQSADGTILLVTAEGFLQGSPGITSARQAEIMASLGARVAVAMDSGGSAQMALGARPVVTWGPNPRRVANALAVTYRGLLVDELPPRISPNADRVDDDATVTVRTPEAGRVTVRIVHRTGRPQRALWAGELGGSSARVIVDPRRLRLRDGIYVVISRLEIAGGGVMEQRRRLIVDRTLGTLTARPVGRRANQRLVVGFRLHRPARVTAVVRTSSGRVVARLAGNRPMRAGRNALVWNRRVAGRPVSGSHRVEVIAVSPLGRTGLTRQVSLRDP
jgi:hypothetical protein